jgi:hypothetical protein
LKLSKRLKKKDGSRICQKLETKSEEKETVFLKIFQSTKIKSGNLLIAGF